MSENHAHLVDKSSSSQSFYHTEIETLRLVQAPVNVKWHRNDFWVFPLFSRLVQVQGVRHNTNTAPLCPFVPPAWLWPADASQCIKIKSPTKSWKEFTDIKTGTDQRGSSATSRMQWPHIWIFQPTFNVFHYKCRFTLRGKLRLSDSNFLLILGQSWKQKSLNSCSEYVSTFIYILPKPWTAFVTW